MTTCGSSVGVPAPQEARSKKIPLHPVALSFLQTLYKEAMEWDHDPLVGYVYDIEQRHAVALAPYASEPIDVERYNCFLESTRPASSRKHIVAAGRSLAAAAPRA